VLAQKGTVSSVHCFYVFNICLVTPVTIIASIIVVQLSRNSSAVSVFWIQVLSRCSGFKCYLGVLASSAILVFWIQVLCRCSGFKCYLGVLDSSAI